MLAVTEPRVDTTGIEIFGWSMAKVVSRGGDTVPRKHSSNLSQIYSTRFE